MQFIIDLLPGVALTMLLWLGICALGFPLGLLFGYALAVGPKGLRVPVVILVNVARGFPGLVVLYFVYSGLPDVGVYLSNTTSVIVAFAFVAAGYTAGIFRAAIAGVPKAQLEAAAVLGLAFWKTQRLVVLPQAFKTVLPPLIGFSVVVLQATSLGYAIGLRELTGLAYNLGAIAFQALPYMLASGLIYLVLCVAISQLAAWLQRRGTRSRVRSGRRRVAPASPAGTSVIRTIPGAGRRTRRA